jgi:GNAT superfamily N-acetyltransferase
VVEPDFRVRPFRDPDYEALAGVNVRSFPDHPLSPGEMRRFDAFLAGAGRAPYRLAATIPPDDALVAYGELVQLPFNYHPQKHWLNVLVDPPLRRRGLGAAMYEMLEHEAKQRGATTLWTTSDSEDAGAARFAVARGFAELRRQRQSRVVLAESRPDLLAERTPAARTRGVEFTTVAAEGPEREAVRRECYRLHEASTEGMPGVGTRVPITFEEFLHLEFSGPGFFPEAHFLARVGGKYVSMTMLVREESRPDVLRVGYTGTDPRFRGQGLATELKRRSIEFARDAGFRAIETWNDFLNPRIWTVNERVGFRTTHTWSTGEKLLGAEPESRLSVRPGGSPGIGLDGADRGRGEMDPSQVGVQRGPHRTGVRGEYLQLELGSLRSTQRGPSARNLSARFGPQGPLERSGDRVGASPHRDRRVPPGSRVAHSSRSRSRDVRIRSVFSAAART